jgi:hypothetical protein
MEIVSAQIKDVPEIISLLKTSLGEKLLPKTEEYFILQFFLQTDNHPSSSVNPS